MALPRTPRILFALTLATWFVAGCTEPVVDVDIEPPDVEILVGPAILTNEIDASFEFECLEERNCSFFCRLEPGPSGPCDSKISYEGLDDGEYLFEVVAVDDSDLESEPAQWSWTIDTVAPLIVDFTGPGELTNQTAATFGFNCSKEGCTFECELNDGTPESCVSGVTFEDLGDGAQVLIVTATDALGTSGPPAEWTWTVDTVAPLFNILESPPFETLQDWVLFEFECSNRPCTFECALDYDDGSGVLQGGDWESCTSPHLIDELAPGDYVLRLRATDEAGNQAFESLEWTVLPPKYWIAVSSRNDHTCAIADDRTLWCWGDGRHGALGIGDTDSRTTPHQVGDDTDWDLVSVGHSNTCGIRTNGSLWCWGLGEFGSHGLGDTQGRDVPHQVGDQQWTTISTGHYFACGIRDDGSLWCWGVNNAGQLGLGNTQTHWSPHQVGDHQDWISISVGTIHACAIRDDSSLWCWGGGTNGELGLGDATSRTDPGLVGGSSDFDWVDVSAGDRFTCGIRDDGSLWCWGRGMYGKLGLGDVDQRNTPHQVGQDLNWSTVSAGRFHACALQDDSSLWCWGRGNAGRLGLGDSLDRSIPHPVGNDNHWASLSARYDHSCGLTHHGLLRCWGSNSSAQLGIGLDGGDKQEPVPVNSAEEFVEFSTGGSSGCGINEQGALFCWGNNPRGQLGLGDQENQVSPQEVETSSIWSKLSAGSGHSCAIQDNGSLWCWGNGEEGRLGLGEDLSDRFVPHQVGDQLDWASVSSGSAHTCGLRLDGSLWCWGNGSSGRLGLGDDLSNRTAPRQVGEDTDWAAVSSGQLHTCGLRLDGSLWCWGNGWDGRLGTDDTQQRNAPVQVGDEADWASISVGGSHTCGLRLDGSLWCWGRNNQGQLGHGDDLSRLIPHQVGDETDWATLSAGQEHTCAVGTDGKLWCWGSGRRGMLGLGDGARRNFPEQVGTDTNWANVYAGSVHTHGLRTDGSLWSWGSNNSGQLGDGSQWREVPTPVPSP